MPPRNLFHFVIFLAALFVCTGTAKAGDCDTMSVTIQTASGGVVVTGSNDVFSVDFGNVNGLGLGTPAAGVSVSRSSTGATYTTPVIIKANFTNCSGGGTLTLKVYQDSTTNSASQTAARQGSAPGSVIAVPSTLASATLITSSPVNGASITRYVGIFVSNANGAGRVTGSLAPRFIFQLDFSG